IVGELELDAIELEELLVLLDERVARLGQDLHQGSLIERRHARNERQAADELRDQTEVHEVFRTHLGQYVVSVGLTPGSGLDPEAEGLLARPLLDDLLQTREGPTHDEQHVRGVDLDELLVRVLAAALRRDRGGGALDDLKQRLLDTLAGDVTGDRRVLRLASHLVDLVDVDDPGLGLLDVVVRGLDQLEQDVLDVLADVARLGQRGGVGDRERHVEHPGERLGEIGLATPGRPDDEDVRLRDLDLLVLRVLAGDVLRLKTRLDAFVVVVHGHGQRLLRLFLADHVRVQELEDLLRLRQLAETDLGALGELLLDDLVAQVDALVADVDTRTRDELLDLLLALAAEGAFEQVCTVRD